MKRSLAILLGVGVLTFTFVQCKTSGPDATRTASKPTSSTKSSSAAPAPVISSPADAAQATIAASQDFINSSDPCQGLDAATCKTLTDAATQTAAVDPSTLAAQMTPQNLTDASNTVTPPTDTATSTETTTDSGTSVASTKTSNNTGAKVAVGLGVPLILLSTAVAIVGSITTYKKIIENWKNVLARHDVRVIDDPRGIGKSFVKTSSYHDFLRTNDATDLKYLNSDEELAYKNDLSETQKPLIKKYGLGIGILTAIWGAGLGSMAYGASVLNSNTGLADGTTGSTPAQTYLNTLDAIGQQVVNNYH